MENEIASKSRYSFSLRTLLELVAIASLILAILYGRTDWMSGDSGRYRLEFVERSNAPTSQFLLDTKTGEVWEYESSNNPTHWSKVAGPPTH